MIFNLTEMKTLLAFLLLSFFMYSCQKKDVNNEESSQQSKCDGCLSLFKNELFFCLPEYFIRDVAFDSTYRLDKYDEEVVNKRKYILKNGFKTLIATDSLGQIWDTINNSVDAVVITTYKMRDSLEININSVISNFIKQIYACNNKTKIVKKGYSKKGRWNMFEVAYFRPYHNIQLFKYEIYIQRDLDVFELIYYMECYNSNTAKKKFLNEIGKIKICTTK